MSDRLVFPYGLNGRIKEVVFFGSLPGLLVDHRRTGGKSIEEDDKRLRYLAEYNEAAQDSDLNKYLRLLYTGNIDGLPNQLHHFLDARNGRKSQKMVVGWVPFYLQLVLQRAKWVGEEAKRVSAAVLDLLNRFVYGDEQWDAFFVIFLLARCVNGDSDGYFLQEDLFAEKPLVELCLEVEGCETWDDLDAAVQAACTRDHATIAVLYPDARVFGADAIVAYLENKKVVRRFGFRFSEPGDAEDEVAEDSKKAPFIGFEKCFVVSGKPPKQETFVGTSAVASDEAINNFFGESGEGWSPQRWQHFYDSAH